jgi:hypothetical protein
MAKSKIRLAQIMERICEEEVQIRRYLEIYRFLDEQKKSEQFERGPAFFTTIGDAAWREAILGITRLTDDDPESINFKMLINMAENHPRVLRYSQVGARELVEINRLKLASLDPLLKSLRLVRDRALAHLDRKHLNDPVVVSPKVIPLQELAYCVNIFQTILSDIWLALQGEPMPQEQVNGQILKEMEALWMIIGENIEKVGQCE